MKRAIGYGNFATTGFSLFNLATMIVTRSFIVHVGVLFIMSDQTTEYFEARFSEGFVGPFPFKKLCAWSDRNAFHRMHVRWLPGISEDSAEEKRQLALQMVRDRSGYAKGQLLSIWAHERLGWKVQTDPSQVTCSEAMTLLNRPEYELTDAKHPNADSVTPASAWDTLNWALGDRIYEQVSKV